MGNIGEIEREIILEPLDEPADLPVTEPAIRRPEPEMVPA